MKRSGLTSCLLASLPVIAFASTAFAQQPLPPPPGGEQPGAQPPPPGGPAPGPADPGAPPGGAPAPAQPGFGPPPGGAPAGEAPPPGAGASGSASWQLGSGVETSGAATGEGGGEMDPEMERQWRRT